MKFFIVFALFALVAAKPSLRFTQAEIDDIIAAINSPSTNHATALVLEQMLAALGLDNPDFQPIQVGPEVIDVDNYEPIHVGPAIVDFPIPESPVAPTPVSSPLVQIIVNVNKPEDVIGSSPVVVEGLDKPDSPTPVNVIEEAFVPEIVEVVDSLPEPPTPVQVIEEAFEPAPIEPVIVAPIIVAPIAVGPEILN